MCEGSEGESQPYIATWQEAGGLGGRGAALTCPPCLALTPQAAGRPTTPAEGTEGVVQVMICNDK